MANATSKLLGGRELPVKVERRYLYFLAGLKADSAWGLSLEDFAQLPMIVAPTGAYARPDNAQLMMGRLQHARPAAATLDNQDDVEPGFGLGLGEYGPAVRKDIAQVLPAVEDMGKLTAVTTGFYDTTPDHNPLFGYDSRIENLLHAVGLSGHGLMHAPFSALIVAELVARGRDAVSLQLPFGLGPVELGSYALDRVFAQAECMVI
jgi:glycine/D-amino acid oxidase-like deaminating enzyme